MSEEKIKRGQIVRLISGGPAMTVTSAPLTGDWEGYVWVIWFTKSGKYRQVRINPDFLELAFADKHPYRGEL